MELLDFNVKKISDNDNYYGFSLDGDNLYLTHDKLVHHNSGKSVLEQAIVGHVSRWSNKFQLVGMD